MTGYIDRVDTMGDRHSGNVVHIGGCDVFSAIVRSEIDPRTRYPEKTPLDKLLRTRAARSASRDSRSTTQRTSM